MESQNADQHHDPSSDVTDEKRDIEAARRVLKLEADSLTALSHAIDGKFIAAVDLLAGTTGRVIVSGMGKSGHIGRKIAATFASTGTPSHYVHPGEASHGDLGMLVAGDTALVMSNSGETNEIGDLLAYAKFRRIPVLAMVGRDRSTLGAAGDVTLALPVMPEACPMGLAPTTSTTMMLALGDALAVALMQRRGFSPEHFQVLHPGGRLGRRFVKVEDLMHTGAAMPLIAHGTAMSEAVITMTACGFGCVGVTGPDGGLLGVVTDGDLRRHMGPGLLAMSVEAVMTAAPRTIRPKALAAEALGLMNANDRPITSLFVAEDGRPCGFIHVHDILRAGIA